MYKGIIESEALINKKILNEVKIVKCYKEKHLDEDPKIWTINKIEINDLYFYLFIQNLSKSMAEGWYSLLWNDKFVYVVFKNRTFKIDNLNPWNKEEFSSIVNYALSLGIYKKYFDNLRKSINDW